jgi:hypothetical protein
MPAFKLSSLLHKDKSDSSSSRRSSILSDSGSQAPITSEPLVSSPSATTLEDAHLAAAASDGSHHASVTSQPLPGTSLVTESGVDLSHRDSSNARRLTLDTGNAKPLHGFSQDHGYSSSDDLDTPIAPKSEAELFQVRSRSSTHGPSAQAIITQPITVDGLGPVVPATGLQTQNLTPAQAVVFAVRSASPSGSSSEATPNAAAVPQFEGAAMQSTMSASSASYNAGVPTPNSAPVTSRSPRANSGLLPPAQEVTTARRFSSASKRPASATILSGDPAPPVHTTSLGPGSSAQSVMSLPATSSAVNQDHGTHTPAEILSKVKNKVRRPRRSADDDSLAGGKKMGKRERLKARLAPTQPERNTTIPLAMSLIRQRRAIRTRMITMMMYEASRPRARTILVLVCPSMGLRSPVTSGTSSFMHCFQRLMRGIT